MARAVSVLVHLVILLVLVVIPALDIVLPAPLVTTPTWIEAAPIPPSPAFRPRTTVVSATNPVRADAPPLTAPNDIAPEALSATPSSVADAVIGPVSSGFGDIDGVGLAVAPPLMVEPPRTQTGPVRVAQLPQPPRNTLDSRPVYPDVARSARVEGVVVLEAVIDTTGRVTQLRVLRSVPLLDQAALDAVRQWRYTPSLVAGQPVSVLMTVTVRFTLQQ